MAIHVSAQPSDAFDCRVCGEPANLNYFHWKHLVARHLCHGCDYWTNHVENRDSKLSVRVDGCHYLIGPEHVGPIGRGYAGRGFVVAFHDGRRVTTTNLWGQGTIPDRWRAQLPDNAVFVHENR